MHIFIQCHLFPHNVLCKTAQRTIGHNVLFLLQTYPKIQNTAHVLFSCLVLVKQNKNLLL